MPKSIMEMVSEIVAGQSSQRILSGEEISSLIKQTYRALREIEELEARGGSLEEMDSPSGIQTAIPDLYDYEITQATSEPKIEPSEAIQEDKIVCVECGKEFKTLTHTHLREHGLSSDEYKQKWGIPAKQPLAALSVTQARKTTAERLGLGERLKMARARKRSEQSREKEVEQRDQEGRE